MTANEAEILRWFRAWVTQHKSRHRDAKMDECGPRSELFYEGWIEAFAKAGVTEQEAVNASRRLQSVEVKREARFHLAAVLKAVAEIRAESRTQSEAASQERIDGRTPEEEAEAQQYNAEVAANWESIPEDEREEWRQLVRERRPIFATSPYFLEGFASIWAHDPRLVPRPDDADRPRRAQRVRRSNFAPTQAIDRNAFGREIEPAPRDREPETTPVEK